MTAEFSDWLDSQAVKSWFDVGLLLDGLGDNHEPSGLVMQRDTVWEQIGKGIALISFEAQGESNRREVSGYAEVLQSLLQASGCDDPAIWWVDDAFAADSETLSARRWQDASSGSTKTHVWDGYADIFDTKLDRGSGAYNALIGKIWSQTCALAPRLAAFVQAQQIQLLLPVNICSTPSHVSLALAIVLVSERLDVPVLSINHSFWWDDPAYRAESGSMPDSRGQFFANAHLGEVFSLVEMLFPWHSPLWAHSCPSQEQRHRLITEFGFNPARVVLLTQDDAQARLAEMVNSLASGLDADARKRRRQATVAAFATHAEATQQDQDYHRIALTRHREYMPGLNKLEYLSTLKSLIDPSAFRMDEKVLRGRVYERVQTMLERCVADPELRREILLNVADLFVYHDGEDELVVDHSLSYRHRQKRHYPFRKLTEQELIGCVSALIEMRTDDIPQVVAASSKTAGDAVAALLTTATAGQGRPGIDDSEALRQEIAAARPIAWLPGDDWQSEALGWVSAALQQRGNDVASRQIVLFASSHRGRLEPEFTAAGAWLATAPSPLAEAYAAGLLRVVETRVLSAGTHLAQLGSAAAELASLREAGGFVIAVGESNFHTLDTLDMESFRIARCVAQPFASFMGLRPGQGFVLRVPAGMRPSLAYPTPIQTPVEFAQALRSELFNKAAQQFGMSAVLDELREDADSNGTPVAAVLERMLVSEEQETGSCLNYKLLTGVHENGDPWSGATACLSGLAAHQWKFHASFAEQSSDTVLAMVERFRRSGGAPVDVAWNGGFILNPELVGKLGLPEDYIGTPLGLLIDDGRVIAPPLFNKPAMAFMEDGSIQLREANCAAGLSVSGPDGARFEFLPEHHNTAADTGAGVFDLMYTGDRIPATGRRLFRLAGDQVLEVIESEDEIELLPVGLTLAFPVEHAPTWQAGNRIQYQLNGWQGVDKAIEAGPMLIRNSVISVEMDRGGWTRQTSIRTQAARIDYMHMRGPKIGVGLAGSGDLVIAAVNGRVRESVGATHTELAQILLDLGAVQGMGFDPGGSVTLVVQGKQLNISPYNKDYLSSPYSLPPQPRFVGNAILAVAGG